MNDERIHACLDGEIPREALTEAERVRLSALEAALAEAVAPLRASPAPDLTDRVLGALAMAQPAAPIPARRPGLFVWLWQPITVRLRPVYALSGAMAVALAGVVLATGVAEPPVAVPMAVGTTGGTRLYVQFRLEAPGASRVSVAGSFTGWRPEHDLREVAPGVWSAMVPLAPGVHDYTFVIDGERRVVDPHAPRVADSFGGSNSRLFLPPPNGSA